MMTSTQFDALASLIRARPGPAYRAAHLVLVDGQRPADAARETGLSASGVGNAVRRMRAAHALARVAAGGTD